MIWQEEEKLEGMREEATFKRTDKRKQGDTCGKKKGTLLQRGFKTRKGAYKNEAWTPIP
jgi:hypothetical protein